VDLVSGVLGKSCRQRIKPGRARAGLLDPEMLDARVASDFDIHCAIDEIGITANTHVPFDQSDPGTRSDLEADTRIRSAGLGFGRRDEDELDASFAVSARGNLDLCAVRCEGLVQQSEAQVRW